MINEELKHPIKEPIRLKTKKIGICHYKIGKTDGVSLEIMKRKKMLENMGYQVKLIAGASGFGDQDKLKDTVIIIPELDFDHPGIVQIKETAFAGFELIKNAKEYEDEDALLENIKTVAGTIKKAFLEINDEEKFDYLFLHNIFSHGRHIAAAKAFYDIIKDTKIGAVAFHHDFYESYGEMYVPHTSEIERYLDKYVPPSLEYIKHVTISSLWKSKLSKKKANLQSMVFPDTFDFKQIPWVVDSYNKDLLKTFKLKDNDLIILQATRIVERKAIELTVDLITELNKRKKELIGKKLYNGKVLDDKSDIVLAFGQFAERASYGYARKLIQKMKKQGVKFRFLNRRIEHERRDKKDRKVYSLWDAYVFADLISYPSTWEGFGNQFLEAVFAKKPIVLFEYPVFEADIKKRGYRYVSLGSSFKSDHQKLAYIEKERLKNATEKTIETMLDPRTEQIVDKNYSIAKKYNGEKVLVKLLGKCLD